MSKTSYFNQRMSQLGLKPGDEEIKIPDPNQKGQFRLVKYFSEDEHGNVAIHYYRLDGAPYTYRKGDNKNADSFKRLRLKKPIDAKYISPKGQGMLPWFPPGIIKKYNKEEAIDTLYVIEGEFKAFSAERNGINAIGIGGIHGFYDKRNGDDRTHFLHPDIADLIRVCKVKRVVMCLDADAIVVKWEYNKDLFERQNSFRTAVANFYKVMQYYVDNDQFALNEIYCSHIKRKFVDEAKGLDDLFVSRPKEKQRIVDDLHTLNEEPKETNYFDFLRLDQNYWTQLDQYFGLESVERFYGRYRGDIGRKQFVFRNAVYVATEDDKDKVRFIYHKDVENFFRIGTDWMKKIRVPNKYGDVDEKIVPFSISEINRDYPPNKFHGFVNKIKKYDAYCNEPDWSPKYSREHSGCYNLANPIVHYPSSGEFKNTIEFLSHIFSAGDHLKIVDSSTEALPEEYLIKEKDSEDFGSYCKIYPLTEKLHIVEKGRLGDPFVVGLDWLTIFHRNPKHMLPVPILVSKEQGTGKSTFFKWLKSIYGSNAAILNNEQFKMRFNAHYITKSLIVIDEGFLDVDKKAEKERLKQMVTSDTAYVEHKGVNLQEFPYYGKVLMGSNDADSVMKLDDEENRWFVVKVDPIKGKDKDPDLEAKLRSEIPAWLHFLERRRVVHPREDRLWFKEKYFITDQFREIVKNTKTRIEKNIDDLIKDFFVTYRVSELKLSQKTLVEMINDRSKYKTDAQEIKNYLQKKLGMALMNPERICYPIGFKDEDESFVEGKSDPLQWSEKKYERYYRFDIDKWVDAEDFSSQEELNEIIKRTLQPEGDDLPF